jgi:hypothetical protein
MKVTDLLSPCCCYQEVSLFPYGKTKTLQVAKFVGDIEDLGKVVVGQIET